MNLTFLEGFNNYYNRTIKKIDTLADYSMWMSVNNKNIKTLPSINFNPNDCVNTTQVINWSESWNPDYVIVDDTLGHLSRWFVIENRRLRGNQFELQLRRDLITDFYDSIMTAPCFIEKANLNYNDPLIFNKEDITVNQIKRSETPLMDKTQCPWLIGYYSKGKTLEGTVDINEGPEALNLNVQDITDWKFYKYISDPMIGPQTYGAYNFKWADGSALSPSYLQIEVNEVTGDATRSTASAPAQLQHVGALLTANQFKNAFLSYGLNNLNPDPYSKVVSQDAVNELLSFDGKLVKSLDGKYYRVRISSRQETNKIAIESGDLFNKLFSIVKTLGIGGTPTVDTFKYIFTAQYYNVSIIEETNLSTKYNITTERLLTTDSPWDIFAIPYGKVDIYSGTDKLFTTSKDYGISTIMSMQANHPGEIYDIQLVPYCPVQSLIIGNKEIAVTDSKEYSFITTGPDNKNIGIIFNVPKSTFDFDITDVNIKPGRNAIERKLNFECDKWRLTSPNFSNYFDFSVEKNGGVSYFNVDINYKPFMPYIHINPNFSYLYGYDDNSPRGLVLGGDFSLSQIIDRWQEYQIQNRNFQNIFDRQIQSMELTQSVQKTQDIVKAITGTAQGATSGAFAGSMMGGGGATGALVGGLVGGLSSAAGGIADYILNERLRADVLDLTKDQFGYELGNIQALPNTISKVSAFNKNNKIFPILEYYSCTNTEKIAVLNKIAYNGMTVMAIGKLENYIDNTWGYSVYDDIREKNTIVLSANYIKGKLIRLEDINCDDFHVVNEIANEIFKGVYI